MTTFWRLVALAIPTALLISVIDLHRQGAAGEAEFVLKVITGFGVVVAESLRYQAMPSRTSQIEYICESRIPNRPTIFLIRLLFQSTVISRCFAITLRW